VRNSLAVAIEQAVIDAINAVKAQSGLLLCNLAGSCSTF
jgi:hypothetical protein